DLELKSDGVQLPKLEREWPGSLSPAMVPRFWLPIYYYPTELKCVVGLDGLRLRLAEFPRFYCRCQLRTPLYYTPLHQHRLGRRKGVRYYDSRDEGNTFVNDVTGFCDSNFDGFES